MTLLPGPRAQAAEASDSGAAPARVVRLEEDAKDKAAADEQAWVDAWRLKGLRNDRSRADAETLPLPSGRTREEALDPFDDRVVDSLDDLFYRFPDVKQCKDRLHTSIRTTMPIRLTRCFAGRRLPSSLGCLAWCPAATHTLLG